MDTTAIDGFRVRCSADFEARYEVVSVKLPTTYSEVTLPMEKDDIPTAERLAKWEHLKEVACVLPEIKDIPLGLLIGRNCPKALDQVGVVHK